MIYMLISFATGQLEPDVFTDHEAAWARGVEIFRATGRRLNVVNIVSEAA